MKEKILLELSTCTNEIEALITQKTELENQAQIKQEELKALNDEIATIQGELIKLNKIMSDLDIVNEWLTPKEKVVNE